MLAIDTLTGLIAPNLCLSCNSEGSVLCDSCIDLYFQPSVPRCGGCFKLSKDSKVCTSCKRWLPLDRIFIATSYEGINEALIKSLKFQYKRQACMPIAKMMGITLEGSKISDYVLCPIPTAPSRIRERGFDHVKLIVEQLSVGVDLPSSKLLDRNTNVRQLGSARTKRIQQMKTEFYCKQDLRGKKILLVDDVMTSGATLAGAASVLKKAGARSISAVVFARQS